MYGQNVNGIIVRPIKREQSSLFHLKTYVQYDKRCDFILQQDKSPITKHFECENDLLLPDDVAKLTLYYIHYDYEVFTDNDRGTRTTGDLYFRLRDIQTAADH